MLLLGHFGWDNIEKPLLNQLGFLIGGGPHSVLVLVLDVHVMEYCNYSGSMVFACSLDA